MIDGIYTAYLSGNAGQGMAMFVFREGKIGGADLAGIVFSGTYELIDGRVVGELHYRMPAGTASITGVAFDRESEEINVPIDLPENIDESEVFRINTPIGPLNARFVKNNSFG